MSKSTLNFSGQNILITGAAGGIGVALVRSFEQLGANIYLHYNHSEAKAQAIAHSLKSNPVLIKADLTNEHEVKAIFSNLPAIQHVVANAGIYENQSSPIHEMKLEQWNKTIVTNLTGTFLTTKYFFQNILKYKTIAPTLTLIGSTAGIFGERGHADYAASKAPFSSGLLYSLKNEMTQISPLGRVNCVAPGWTLTPMAQNFLTNQEAVKKTLQTLAMKKLANPDDIANAVLYLTSNLASHVTGETLKVTGGMEGRVLWDKEEISL